MTLNLLLFAVNFTIFLEIEFDFIYYVRYRSEEISPFVVSVLYDLIPRSILSGLIARNALSVMLALVALMVLNKS